jgi:hypothetical protein
MGIEQPMAVSHSKPILSSQLISVMRFLADGKIRWCFFPPNTSTDRTGKGIWLGGAGVEGDVPEDSDGATTPIQDISSEEEDDDSDVEVTNSQKTKTVQFDVEESDDEEGEEDEEEEDDSDEATGTGGGKARGFFAALQLEDQSDSDDDEEVNDGSLNEESGVDDRLSST